MTKGGGWFESSPPHPPSPPDPQNFSYPPFCNLRFCGQLLAPQAPNNFFFGLVEGVKNLFTLCIYTQNAQTLVENSKVGEKH